VTYKYDSEDLSKNFTSTPTAVNEKRNSYKKKKTLIIESLTTSITPVKITEL
jgi:hypothetical protein